MAIHDQSRREAIGATEAETFLDAFLRSLARRGLRGVQRPVSDDRQGLQSAAPHILGTRST